MAGNAKPSVAGIKGETSINLNGSFARSHNGAMDVYNDISALFDGATTTTSVYGTLLLMIGGVGQNYIDFDCYEDIKIWCIGSKAYSDGGGGTPKNILIEKFGDTGWATVSERSTYNNGTWYDLTGVLEAGRYRIRPKSNYVVMDEWYVERVRDGNFLLQDDNGIVKSITPSRISNVDLAMTSNTTPSGVASASSQFSADFPAWKAFNRTTTDINDCWVTANNVLTGWLQFKFNQPKIIEKYAVTSRNATYRGDIKAWTFEGSNDGINWKVLDERKYESTWNPYEKREYNLKVKFNSFLYYRINVTETTMVGGATYLTIGELTFYERSSPDLIVLDSYDKDDFTKYGMYVVEPDVPIMRIRDVVKTSSSLGKGKTFSHRVDLEKYKASKIILGE
ncbi:discoidin domain-containing protein [Paenibacillus sp. Mc5Re-14]|uniref:discoidin domain-containing protein n=1 Tax=Paenibacillus sp. Mc5Re-14 TaxID=1030529 RepID=UPI000A5AA920|nr:discoidin domain-containing protein [Paenibacillus sp. Mc5Re-14]